ncbi:hypothetical protein, partial [Reyranella soli]|uniref:hypothetical protein n=1 Tax=Reyranella soli TaxID=1230389 RepID=UPI001C3FDFFA
ARRTLLELIGFDVGVHPSGDALRRGDAAWRPQLAELWEATVAAARRAALDDLPIDMHRGTAALRR